MLDVGSMPLALYWWSALIVLPLLGNLVPGEGLLPDRHALLRRQLGVERVAVPRRQLQEARPAEARLAALPGAARALAAGGGGAARSAAAWRSARCTSRAARLGLLLPRAIGGRPFQEYRYVDSENVAGSVLGWNFGEGHLGDERLLACVQEQCGFEDGELRAIMVESQPILGSTLHWRIVDAKRGRPRRGLGAARRARRRASPGTTAPEP